MLCLVTDSRRLTVAGGLVAQARAAVAAGIDLIQVRERHLETRALAALVASLLEVTRGSATRLVVNDRLDVSLACGADGVHLRADSMTAEAARSLAPPGFLIGRSVHSAAEARAAVEADYLVAGTVFPTASKPHAIGLGVDGLRAIVSASPIPVLAIGGVTIDRVPAIASTGAAGIAAIGLFARDDLAESVRNTRRLFDSLKPRP